MNDELKHVFNIIAKDESNVAYFEQKSLLSRLFETTKENYSKENIVLRLTVLDSMYTTNASFNYFGLEHIADKILSFGDESKFIQYAKTIREKGADDKELFSTQYGIRKNLSLGSLQTSLLSKYIYYVFMTNKDNDPIGFPIYDNLAVASYPKLCKILGITKNKTHAENIHTYIDDLDIVRKKIFDKDVLFDGMQQFDILDAYLWRMGKFSNGNLSLLLAEDDYKKFIKNLKLEINNGESAEEYNKRMWTAYPALCSKEDKQRKGTDGIVVTTYSADINKIIVEKFKTMKAEDIFKGLSDKECMSSLLNHWKENYITNKN